MKLELLPPLDETSSDFGVVGEFVGEVPFGTVAVRIRFAIIIQESEARSPVVFVPLLERFKKVCRNRLAIGCFIRLGFGFCVTTILWCSTFSLGTPGVVSRTFLRFGCVLRAFSAVPGRFRSISFGRRRQGEG